MILNEFQAKQLLKSNGVPVPAGEVADSAEQAAVIAKSLGGKAVVKALVLTGGRGKAGGIRLGTNSHEVRKLTNEVLGMQINDLTVEEVLVEAVVNIQSELYVSITTDHTSGKPLLICSGRGGIDIEETASRQPSRITCLEIHPLIGLQAYQTRDAAVAIGLNTNLWGAFQQVLENIWKTYVDFDASLVEINPMVITTDDDLVALDAKVVIDDNAMYRQPDIKHLLKQGEQLQEVTLHDAGFNYLRLVGDIGCLVNGAGLAMATMDAINLQGGKPANFLDIGGGAIAARVEKALRIILANEHVKSLLINIFGGITRCDEVAKGIITAKKTIGISQPVIIRLVGTQAEEGLKLLEKEEFITAMTLKEAAMKAIEAARSTE